MADIDTVDPESDYMLLMTLHSAKGLEFDRVFMAGMEEAVFPGLQTGDGNSGELEEERRLCYVGMTRAKKQLIMTAARQRMLRGEWQQMRVSRFVREIPRDLVELERDTTDTRRALEETKPSPEQVLGIGRKKVQPQPFKMREFVVEKASSLEYGPGDRVQHQKFGAGTVQEIRDGGKDYEVTVLFDTYGIRRMFASFARLKKL